MLHAITAVELKDRGLQHLAYLACLWQVQIEAQEMVLIPGT